MGPWATDLGVRRCAARPGTAAAQSRRSRAGTTAGRRSRTFPSMSSPRDLPPPPTLGTCRCRPEPPAWTPRPPDIAASAPTHGPPAARLSNISPSTAGIASALVLARADSRLDPATIVDAVPRRDLRHPQRRQLAPPASQPDGAVHGTSASPEFGLVSLGVRDLIVLGHGQCGGVHAPHARVADAPSSVVGPWLHRAEPERRRFRFQPKVARPLAHAQHGKANDDPGAEAHQTPTRPGDP